MPLSPTNYNRSCPSNDSAMTNSLSGFDAEIGSRNLHYVNGFIRPSREMGRVEKVVRRELGRSEQCAPDEARSAVTGSLQRLSDWNRPPATPHHGSTRGPGVQPYAPTRGVLCAPRRCWLTERRRHQHMSLRQAICLPHHRPSPDVLAQGCPGASQTGRSPGRPFRPASSCRPPPNNLTGPYRTLNRYNPTHQPGASPTGQTR